MAETIGHDQTVEIDRLIDSIKEARPNTLGLLTDYLENFQVNYKSFVMSRTGEQPGISFLQDIEKFLQYRDEFIKIIIQISKYNLDGEIIKAIHRFFESILPYNNFPEGANPSNNWVLDNLKFVSHELFLYTMAILIRFERFEQANLLLTRKYLVPNSPEYPPDSLVSFSVFRKQIESLDLISENENGNQLILRAQLLKKRNQNIDIDFKYIMQADFILFLRHHIDVGSASTEWYPYTLYHATDSFPRPFELFIRAESNEYFEKLKRLINIRRPEDLKTFLQKCSEDEFLGPQWGYARLNMQMLMNIDKLTESHTNSVTVQTF